MVTLFTYGTLMRGQRGHGLLRGALFVGRARTAPCFTLLDAGRYPGLVRGGHTSVAGELYRVGSDLLRSLDVYEDVAEGEYRRAHVCLAGRRVATYLLAPDHARGLRPITSGDWRRP